MTTISNNYFEEYTEFINNLQNRIMKIQLKYNECQSAISTDFAKGFIAKEVAEKMLAVRINQYVPSMDRKYRLTKEEIDFINQYAALDSTGNVLATILKPEYLEKSEMMDAILRSVQTIDFYEKLDPTSKRIKVKTELIAAFSRRISSLNGKLLNIKRVRGEDAEKSSTYKQIQEEIEKCTSAIDSFEQIMEYDDETVRKVISSFYHVDYMYYEWYQNMELRSLKETDELYTEHTKTMERTKDFGTDLIEGQNKVRELNTDLTINTNALLAFLEAILEYDIETFEEENIKSLGFFKKAKLQDKNKELLTKLFINLSPLPGVTTFLQETFYKEEQAIELTECFNKYFTLKYGEATNYVELSSFLLTFKKAVVAFYKEKINNTQKELESQIKINGGIKVAVMSGVEKSYDQALLQEKVYNATNIEMSSLLLEGFTEEELQMMYESLKNILNNTNYLDIKPDNQEKKGLK